MDTQTPPYLLQEAALVKPQPWWRRQRWFLALVVLPTAIAAVWLFLFAADQYESQAHFLVRSADTGGGSAEIPGALQMFGLGGTSNAAGQAMSIADYLDSHDAVAAANAKLDLVAIFRRPEADIISRLWNANPEAETLARHYRRHVDISYDVDTGITDLAVTTYRPEDSRALAETLLALGEARVNALNARAQDALLQSSQAQLAEAEAALGDINTALAAYRQQQRQVDPALSGKAETELATTLRGELAALRAQEATMAGISASSPQRIAVRRRIAALAAEVASVDARLSGEARGISAGIGNFENLRMRQEFAAKRYELAAAMYEKARMEAMRQNLFVVRVVEPNLPERALYPQRFTIVLTLFSGLALAYGIGWLILAGVREHAS